jgi:hypothetical protein
VRGGGAAQHAEQEAGRHEQQLEHRDLLELPRVQEGQAQVGGYRRGEQRLPDEQARGQPGQGTERAEHDRVPLGQFAGGHRPVPLARVQAVTFGVGHVVDEVHRGRGHGEHGRRCQRVAEAVVAAQRGAGQRRGEHQQVLRPLPGPGGLHRRGQPAHRQREPGERARASWRHPGRPRAGGHRAYTAVKSRLAGV